MKNITKEQFNKYESVRQSGATNMFNVQAVCELSGLSREVVLVIMENYEDLGKRFV